MSLFYSIKNLKVYKTRTIIMVITLAMIVTASVVGLSIQNAAQGIGDNYRKQIGAEINIGADYDKVNQTNEVPDPIPAEILQKISQLKEVVDYSLFGEIMGGSKQIKAVGEDEQVNEDTVGTVLAGENGEPIKVKSPKLRIIGFEGDAEIPEFSDGSRKIVQGAAPENINDALISEELAKLNGLKVGDKFKVHDASEKIVVELTVHGIFEDSTPRDGGTGVDMPIFNRRNEIYTTFATAMTMQGHGGVTAYSTFVIDDPDNFEAFEEQVRALGVSDDFKISVDQEGFDKAVGPIYSLNNTVGYFVKVIILVGVGILILLSVSAIRERQYEIGVLRAIGIKKQKVAFSFIIESCITLAIALVIGFAIGTTISQPIADNILQDQIKTMENTSSNNSGPVSGRMFGQQNKKDIETVTEIDVSMEPIVIAQITAISFVIILITNSINMVYVMRFQPMEIMRSKN